MSVCLSVSVSPRLTPHFLIIWKDCAVCISHEITTLCQRTRQTRLRRITHQFPTLVLVTSTRKGLSLKTELSKNIPAAPTAMCPPPHPPPHLLDPDASIWAESYRASRLRKALVTSTHWSGVGGRCSAAETTLQKTCFSGFSYACTSDHQSDGRMRAELELPHVSFLPCPVT